MNACECVCVCLLGGRRPVTLCSFFLPHFFFLPPSLSVVSMETVPTHPLFAESGKWGCSLTWLILPQSLDGISDPFTKQHGAAHTGLEKSQSQSVIGSHQEKDCRFKGRPATKAACFLEIQQSCIWPFFFPPFFKFPEWNMKWAFEPLEKKCSF